MNKCRIYDEDSRVKSAHYKSVSEKKNESQNRGKPYVTRVGKGNLKFQHKVAGGGEMSGEGVYASLRCFKYGELGHRVVECKSTCLTCFKCGKYGHCAADCKSGFFTCFNCGKLGHISTQCQKLGKAPYVA